MSDQLEHYGVKGMEWGKKKKSQTNGGGLLHTKLRDTPAYIVAHTDLDFIWNFFDSLPNQRNTIHIQKTFEQAASKLKFLGAKAVNTLNPKTVETGNAAVRKQLKHKQKKR